MDMPDFSGAWRFNRELSSLQIPAPDSTVFLIRHHEPEFHLERTHVFGDSRDVFSIDLQTNGRSVDLTHGDTVIRARLYWEADELVFYSELHRGGTFGTNVVRYRLTNSGRTFTALERLDSPGQRYVNNWVFDRG